MGKKASKASRKYAASGQLQKEIKSRRKHQQIKRNIERKRSGKPKDGAEDKENVSGQRKGKEKAEDVEEGDEEGGDSDGETGQYVQNLSRMEIYEILQRFKGMSVDDFLKGDFMDDGSDKVTCTSSRCFNIVCFIFTTCSG